MRKILAACVFALFSFSTPVLAQSTSVVMLPGGCGTGNAVNSLSYLTVDSALRLCVSGSGSGGSIIVSPPSFTGSAPSGALTLATAATSQVLFAANEVIHGCFIQNPSTATEPIWINTFTSAVGSAGGTSEQVTPGQTVGCGSSFTTPISWVAATQGHAINAAKF